MMRTDDFDFNLPADRIALRPARPREAAQMLAVRPGSAPEFADHTIRDLPDLLRAGDVLVVNDTKVIAASLSGRRISRGEDAVIDLNLVKRLDAARWQAFVKGAKKLKTGDVVRFGAEGGVCQFNELDATVEAKSDSGEVTFAFSLSGPALDDAIAAHGAPPLPPYIASKRVPDAQDHADYQTMFATRDGAVAAPTAGLHFTPDLIAALAARGVALRTVTLHVGAGTFLPVKAEDVADHRMHSEWGMIDVATADALNAARAAGGRVVAVGTTSLRVLESAADEAGVIRPFCDETAIFITPGYRFRAVDVLLTNFHLPRSTLFMLVSAFSGMDTMKHAYVHAIAAKYRFYSYGDACLLFRDAG